MGHTMHDLLAQFFFYVFAGLAVFSAIMVITQNNPVRSVLFLILTFFAAALLWMLLEAEFLSLILVLVYVGAVMTLFLFVIMMLNLDTGLVKTPYFKYMFSGIIMLALVTGLLLTALPKAFILNTDSHSAVEQVAALPESKAIYPTIPIEASSYSNTEQIGMVLYTQYVFAFELAAILLLVAIIAAITLANRPAKGSRQQNIRKQIMTRRSDRITLVSLDCEITHKEHK